MSLLASIGRYGAVLTLLLPLLIVINILQAQNEGARGVSAALLQRRTDRSLTKPQINETTGALLFVTRPDIEAPTWQIEVKDKDALAPGYWFIAPYKNLRQTEYPLWNGPLIFRSDGTLIWSGTPLFHHRNTLDFRAIDFHGKPALSLIDPMDEHGSGVVLDSSYRIQHTVDLRGDLEETNMHDFTIVDDGRHALALTKIPGNSTKEESKMVGFDGECTAGWEGFKMLDVQTSEIVFDWSAHGHIALNESTKKTASYKNLCTRGWDILHLNSIDKFPDGDFLLSSRHTDTLYKISGKDGSIVWRLGGKLTDFSHEKKANFSRQHHARVRGQNETHILISVFDNAKGSGGNEHKTNQMSRGLLLSLDVKDMKVKMLEHYDHPHGKITPSRGSMQYLPNGNALVCFSYGSLMAEYSHNGTILMEAHVLEDGEHTYRAFKLPWVGHPVDPPDVVSVLRHSMLLQPETVVHVSWNGATEVARWDLRSMHANGTDLGIVASAPCNKFESVVTHSGHAEFVQLEAYDADDNLLGTSNIVETIVSQQSVTDFAFHSPTGIAIIVVVASLCVVLVLYLTHRRGLWRTPWSKKTQPYALLDEEFESFLGEDLEEEEEKLLHDGLVSRSKEESA